MDAGTAVACVCFIGKQNQPLALKIFNGEDEVAMETAVFCALDIIEDKVAEQQRENAVTFADPFLGNISPAFYMGDQSKDYRVYAYVSSTRLKVVVLLEDRDHPDAEVSSLLRQLHRLYADSICNPFSLGSIDSTKFDSRLRGIVSTLCEKKGED